MKTLATLTSDLRSLIDQCFRFKTPQNEMATAINKWFDDNMLTDTGKKRYPSYYSTSLRAFWYEFINVRMSEKTLFCYNVDGELFSVYNALKADNYLFTGKTEIRNYKDDPSVERKILDGKGDYIGGYYYPCGKPYFVTEHKS